MKRLAFGLFFLVFANLIFAAKAENSPPPAYVTAIKVTTKPWQNKIRSTGTLVSEKGVTIRAAIDGDITKVFVKSGEYVKAGQPLVQIYPNILDAQLQQDEATLRLAKINYKRYTNLIKKKATSLSQFDQAQAQFSEAKAAVAKVKAQLAQTLIKAPFSGYLGIRKVDLGTYVSTGDVIVNLEDTNPMFVDFDVPEVYSKKVKKGLTVAVTSEAYNHQWFYGKVVAIESLINPNTRMLEVRAEIPNDKNILIPGSFVVVNTLIGKPKPLVYIPQIAVQYAESGNYVYVVKDHKAIKKSIQLGERDSKGVYVLSGLKPGELVITSGQQRLYDGAEVVIKK